MMSKKQWLALLCTYVLYLLFGATVFYHVESAEELQKQEENRREKIEIEDLLIRYYLPSKEHSRNEIFNKLTTYCGKPLQVNASDIDPPLRWDFYHSLFFVITVVSTVGYGNLAPTTTFTRIFMIFYGTLGISMNGIVIVTLGEYFAKSFLKLYDRWKTLRVQHALATFGLVGQVVLYLIPGFTFFIFLPSILIMMFESWDYDVAVAYAFVTLTTIGFGDYVAGMEQNGYSDFLYIAYKIFLLVWIILGLGYLAMVLSFVTRGLRSNKMHEIERKIAHNLKKTNQRISEELRSILNEYLLMRVKRVYREKSICVPTKCYRSQSCPDLTIYRNMESPTMKRKRALSECIYRIPMELPRIQSDTDLGRIDKEKTFKPSAALVEPSHLLLRVVNALGNYETLHSATSSSTSSCSLKMEGVDMFPSNDILANETYGSGWSIGSQNISGVPSRLTRPRAASECKQPINDKLYIKNNDMTWYGPAATKRLQELRQQAIRNGNRNRNLSVFSSAVQPQNFFTRLKNTFKSTKEDEKVKNVDIERQDYTAEKFDRNRADDQSYNREAHARRSSAFSIIEKDHVLEETSIADFLRALTAISVPEIASTCPKRKYGTASFTPPQKSPAGNRRYALNTLRRTSLIQPISVHNYQDRRLSLRPEMVSHSGSPAPPPPYYESSETNVFNIASRAAMRNRRFSLRPVSSLGTDSPVQRRTMKLKQIPPQDVIKHNKDKNSKI